MFLASSMTNYTGVTIMTLILEKDIFSGAKSDGNRELFCNRHIVVQGHIYGAQKPLWYFNGEC